MGGRSTFSGCMLALLVIVALAGLYVMVDNFDLIRQSQSETKRAIEENTRATSRLLNSIKAGGFSTISTDPSGSQAAKKQMPFHNSDLMDPDAEKGGVRVSATSNFSGNMNYIINNVNLVGNLWDSCVDVLGRRNYVHPNRFEPRIAESWTVSPDGKEITVKLRSGIYWHDFTDPITKKKWENVPVTSHDFVFFVDTIRNPDLPCDPIRSYYKDLDRIEIIDDLNFKIIWKETYFLSLEYSLLFYPLPRHLYRPDPNTTDKEYAEDMLKNKAARNQIIVGCGPYIFDEYIKGERIVLRRNPDFYGPAPNIDRMEIRLIKDPEKEFIEFQRDTIDIIGLTSVQWTKQTSGPEFLTVCDDVDNALEVTRAYAAKKKAAELAGESLGDHKYEKFLYRSFAYYYIGWNMRNPILADREVRVALTHCINRKRIIEEVYLNLGAETTGNFLPNSIYYDRSIEPWPFDIEKAKDILKNAGWEDTDGDGVIDKDLNNDGARTPFEFTFLMIAGSQSQAKWVPMIQEDLKRAGIQMKVKSAEWSVYTEQLDEFNFDACSLAWAVDVESDPYQLWHGSLANKKGSSNYCGFNNAEANEIIETARRTLDLDKRVALYKRFHRIIHEEQPYTFLFFPYACLAQSNRFNNAIVYPYCRQGMSSSLQWITKRRQR